MCKTLTRTYKMTHQALNEIVSHCGSNDDTWPGRSVFIDPLLRCWTYHECNPPQYLVNQMLHVPQHLNRIQPEKLPYLYIANMRAKWVDLTH